MLKIKFRLLVALRTIPQMLSEDLTFFCVSQQGCQWEIPGGWNPVMVQPVLETEQHWIPDEEVLIWNLEPHMFFLEADKTKQIF